MRNSFIDRLQHAELLARRDIHYDAAILAVLLITMWCGWGGVLRWITLGAILMYLPLALAHVAHALEIRRLGAFWLSEKPYGGKHSSDNRPHHNGS